MRESTVEGKLRDGVRKAGGLCLKFVSPGFAGTPDRIILMPGGKVYFVECKRPKGGVVSEIQKKVHSLFEIAGFPVHIVATKADLQKFLLIL